MTVFRTIGTAAGTFAVVLTLTPIALGSGEPKNEWPFTRPVGQRTTQGITARTPTENEAAMRAAVGQARSHSVMHRSAAETAPAIQGEPKNEPPFTRPATVVVVSSSGFDWADGGIGVAAGIGIALAGAGAIALTRKSPRTA
jgi:hypothetical protein